MALTTHQATVRATRGFTLLIAVIFTSVMLTLGLTLVSLAYKQVLLASTATASQDAFYAADAGLECALYGDQKLGLFMPPNGASPLPCDGQNFTVATSTSGANLVSEATITLDNNQRCAQITVYKPSSGTTYLFSQGYNASCATVASPNGTRFVSRGMSTRY